MRTGWLRKRLRRKKMPLTKQIERSAEPYTTSADEVPSAEVITLAGFRPQPRTTDAPPLRLPPLPPTLGLSPRSSETLSSSNGADMATDNDLTEAKISAAEARTDTKIVRIEGKIDTAVATLLGEMKAIRDDVRSSDQYNRDSRFFILGSILAAVLALAAIAVAMATYGDALFGRGMNVRDVVQTTIKDTLEHQNQITPPSSNPK